MPDDTFKEFVLDQLAALPELRVRAMFGGHGLYQAERFFAILFDGRLYFRVNDETGGVYLKRGMQPFTYEMKGRIMAMNYYEVPPDILETRTELITWAKQAIEVVAASPKRSGKKSK